MKRLLGGQLRGMPVPVGMVTTALPKGLQATEAGQRGFYYSLPSALVAHIVPLIGQHLPSQGWQTDLELARLSEHNAAYVGYRNGNALEYHHLAQPEPLPELNAELIKSLNWDLNIEQVNFAFKKALPSLNSIARTARAYVGWLITNQQFLAEHDALLQKWADQIRDWGIAGVGRIVLVGETAGYRTPPDSEIVNRREFDEAVRGFLIRWRLNEIVGPDLPVPIRPMMAGVFPLSVAEQLMQTGGVFNLPDTFPIPSRDELRTLLANVLRPSEDASHLAEWFSFIRKDNAAKHTLDKFARMRVIAHYWRVIHSRYADALPRRKEKLRLAFADFLKVSDDTIKLDLRTIQKRLGKDWEHRDACALVN